MSSEKWDGQGGWVIFGVKGSMMQGNGIQKVFLEDEAIGWEVIGEGLRRKVMAWDEWVMLVKVEFQKWAIGAVHQHPHSQVSYVESGVFEVEISGERRVLKAGDVFLAPSNTSHGVLCLEAGVLIDVFSPLREDLLPR